MPECGGSGTAASWPVTASMREIVRARIRGQAEVREYGADSSQLRDSRHPRVMQPICGSLDTELDASNLERFAAKLGSTQRVFTIRSRACATTEKAVPRVHVLVDARSDFTCLHARSLWVCIAENAPRYRASGETGRIILWVT
jgi:hypothetical protein